MSACATQVIKEDQLHYNVIIGINHHLMVLLIFSITYLTLGINCGFLRSWETIMNRPWLANDAVGQVFPMSIGHLWRRQLALYSTSPPCTHRNLWDSTSEFKLAVKVFDGRNSLYCIAFSPIFVLVHCYISHGG